MIYKNLGSSNTKISLLGIGTNGLGNFLKNNPLKTKNRQTIYEFAYDNGINLFDTAELYGKGYSEFILGKTFQKNRKDIIISCKVNPDNCTSYLLEKSLKRTLKNLKTDYIDLYQLHWPNPFVEFEETFTTLDDFVQKGYVRHIGVCNFTPEMIIEAKKYLKKAKIVSNQLELNLFYHQDLYNDIEFYEKMNISIFGYGALNHLHILKKSKLYKSFLELQNKYKKEGLIEILIKYFTTLKAVVLLIKTDNLDHLKENISAFNFNLEEKDYKTIKKLLKKELNSISLKKIIIPKFYKETTLELNQKSSFYEIVKNDPNLIPSPLSLAKIYIKYKFFKPIKLIEENNRYILDTYDFWGEYKKYLAWKLLYGFSKPIPAIILNK